MEGNYHSLLNTVSVREKKAEDSHKRAIRLRLGIGLGLGLGLGLGFDPMSPEDLAGPFTEISS
jgi:hypothetical protein